MESAALFSPEANLGHSIKKCCLWKIGSGLYKKTMLFFCLLILMSSLLSVVTIYHNEIGESVADILVAMGDQSGRAAGQTFGGHSGLEFSMAMMTVALVFVLITFMLFFIRKIVRPLNELENKTREMADGRLSLLVQDNKTATCAIGAIGENVNSLAMNLQEVLLLAWNLSEHNLETVEQILAGLDGDDEISPAQMRNSLNSLKAELQQMQNFTRQFEFFDVTLQGKKALAKEDSMGSQPN